MVEIIKITNMQITNQNSRHSDCLRRATRAASCSTLVPPAAGHPCSLLLHPPAKPTLARICNPCLNIRRNIQITKQKSRQRWRGFVIRASIYEEILTLARICNPCLNINKINEEI